MGLFGAILFFTLLLLIFSATNHGWGVALCSGCQTVLAILLFALAAALAAGLIGLSDACPNMEAIVVQQIPVEIKPLARYFLPLQTNI